MKTKLVVMVMNQTGINDILKKRSLEDRNIYCPTLTKEHIADRDMKRIARLLNRFYESKLAISSERAILVTAAYNENKDEPIQIKRAKVLKKILEEITITINPDELIVGQMSPTTRGTQVFPECCVDWLEKEMDEIETREQDPFIVPEDVKEDLRSRVIPYWKENEKTLKQTVINYLSEEAKNQLFAEHSCLLGWCAFQQGIGHVLTDLRRVIRKGFEGIKEEAEKKLESLNEGDSDFSEKEDFYKSIIIVCEAVCTFGRRHAKEAERLAEQESDPQRREELRKIAEVCRRVPANPARNFWEAVQSLWFACLIQLLEVNGVDVTIGRADQYLYPYYKKDIDERRLTKGKALEILDCTWIKLSETSILYDKETAKYLATFIMGENLVLGGQCAHGKDVTNELSYLMLHAQEDVGLMQPNLAVRWHTKTPREFRLKALDVIRKRNALPQIVNDNIYIPSLLSRGIPLRDARRYALVGCSQPYIPEGIAGGHLTCLHNVGKIFELALNGGKCMLCGKQLAPRMSKLTEVSTVNEILQNLEKLMKFYSRISEEIIHAEAKGHRERIRTPIKSALMKSCMENGRDLHDGGADFYWSAWSGVCGVGTVTDSLAAIEKLVFEEKRISKAELMTALENNFEGKEELRRMLMDKAPKYGNDIDYVDKYACKIMRMWDDYLWEDGQPRFSDIRNEWSRKGETVNSSIWPAYMTVSAHIWAGEKTGATPNGRYAMTPLNDSISPSQGSDQNGATLAMKSVTKLDHMQATGGIIYNMRFSPELVKDGVGLGNAVNLIRSYFDLGGGQIQLNIIGTKTLKDAQKNPEEYKDLIVRVVGYGARFVELRKELQDAIIRRTEVSEY